MTARRPPIASTLVALALLLAPMLAPGARADVRQAVQDHILPGYERLAQATRELDDAARASCDPGQLTPGFHAAYDAWMAVQHLHFGPVEDEGRGLAIQFWPDPKALGAKAQAALLAGGDAAQLQPDAFARQSVAARGLPALERLLFPETALPADPCPLIRATTADLARTAATILQGWRDSEAALLIGAGQAGNARYLSQDEARQVLFTQLVTGLQALADQRIGRPLGTFDAPTPQRAEARASGRSLRNVTLSLMALRDLAQTLTDGQLAARAPATAAGLDQALSLAQRLDDPDFAGVARPEGRLRVEILQQAVIAAADACLADLAPALGVGLGFNAADGD